MARRFRWIRIVVSLALLALLTGALAAWGMTLPAGAAWLAHVQILPTVASFAILTFVIWLMATLMFGRIYCSSVCPLGTVMDCAARLRRFRRRDGLPADDRLRYRYQRPLTTTRYVVLALVLTCLIGGAMVVPSLFDPYTAYERFCLSCLHPLWCRITGIELSAAAVQSSYPPLMIAMSSVAGALVGLATVAFVWIAAAISGRSLCNTLCPVGTTLGMVARYSIFQMDIDTDLCTQCRRCVDICKSSCIQIVDHTVDGSRCVVCFDCADVCPTGAMRYTASRKQLSLPMMQRIETRSRSRVAGQSTACSNNLENHKS